MGGNDEAKVLCTCDAEFALLEVSLKARVRKPLKHFLYVEVVVKLVLGVDENVVEVRSTEVVKVVKKYVVHVSLVCCRAIG